jgi:RNA polymerase sigma factor (sigma-70 family)
MSSQKDVFTDDSLIDSLKTDSASNGAIRFMYRQYFAVLSRYVLTNNGSGQDAEDVFQEVIVAFVNLVRADKFRGESSIKTFLYSLNKNIWLNELKRRGRASAREEKYEIQNRQKEPWLDKALELTQTKAGLMNAVNELGENCKKILLLFYFDNKSMKEILAYLPYENEQVVRNKKSKCLKRLEELVTGNPNLYRQLKNFANE